MTTEHREPTAPNGLGFWYFDSEGFFYVGTRFGPTAISQFLSGPGCDPTAITDADAGIVNGYMGAHVSTVTAQTFAEVREAAWMRWREVAHKREPLPWWADGAQAAYAAERAAARIELTIESEDRAAIDALTTALRDALPAATILRSAGIGSGLPPIYRVIVRGADLAAVGAVLAAAELARLREANAAMRQALALHNLELDDVSRAGVARLSE